MLTFGPGCCCTIPLPVCRTYTIYQCGNSTLAAYRIGPGVAVTLASADGSTVYSSGVTNGSSQVTLCMPDATGPYKITVAATPFTAEYSVVQAAAPGAISKPTTSTLPEYCCYLHPVGCLYPEPFIKRELFLTDVNGTYPVSLCGGGTGPICCSAHVPNLAVSPGAGLPCVMAPGGGVLTYWYFWTWLSSGVVQVTRNWCFAVIGGTPFPSNCNGGTCGGGGAGIGCGDPAHSSTGSAPVASCRDFFVTVTPTPNSSPDPIGGSVTISE